MLLGLGDEEDLFERLDGDGSGDVSLEEWFEGFVALYIVISG